MPESTLIESAAKAGARFDSVIGQCATALRHLADYELEPDINQRMRDLGERKESLSPEEHAELEALVTFGEKRAIEKLEAQAALKNLGETLPELLR
jgi:hypothetical protein